MNNEQPEKVVICCGHCGQPKEVKPLHDGSGRLPLGWHRRNSDNKIYCSKCWHDNYCLRAVTFPIAGTLLKEDWKTFMTALKKGWKETTALANWCVQTLYQADKLRTPTMTYEEWKKIKYTPPYLYGAAKERFGDEIKPAAIVSVIARAVEKKYKTKRYEVVWKNEAALPTYRYPQPYPIRSDSWSAEYGQDNIPLINVPIAGEKFTLRLRGGNQFRRQLGSFAKLIKGEAEQSELAIYQVSGNKSDNRKASDKKSFGRIMVKLVMWLPKEIKNKHPDGVFHLRTDKDAMLYGVMDGMEKPFIFNGDQVRGWIAQHERRRQRLSEDMKYEKRWPKAQREGMLDYQDTFCRHQRNRLKTFIDQTASMVAKWCVRRNVAQVIYDDSDQSYVEQFPFFALATQLENRLAVDGIKFEQKNKEKKKKGAIVEDIADDMLAEESNHASGEVGSETP